MRYARRQVLFGAVLVVVCVMVALAVWIVGRDVGPPPPPPAPVSVPGGASPAPPTPPTVGPQRRPPDE